MGENLIEFYKNTLFLRLIIKFHVIPPAFYSFIIHIILIIISMNIKDVMIISKIDNNDTKLAFEFFS